EVLKTAEAYKTGKSATMDLSLFKTQINQDALEKLLKAVRPAEVIFAESVKNSVVEAKTFELQRSDLKSLKCGYWVKNEVVYAKPISMSISTSTASSSSPMLAKKNEGNSPDNSPPKTLQTGKPLPAVPPKALPKLPAQRNPTQPK